MTEAIDELVDRQAREEALDITRSFLVQAPAGSGKTELLTMRILKLLAHVEEPEQVLAITFTRAATAEMRHRILKYLEAAKQDVEGVPLAIEDRTSIEAARAALDNSNRRGWRLLEQPQRLNIQTIDSLCLRIAHRMPIAARLSGTLEPTEEAEPLYRKAARNTLDRLGGEDAALNTALAHLLLLRDSNLADVEGLLTGMLKSRDQWAKAFPLAGDVDWQQARAELERPFQRECSRIIGAVHAIFSTRTEATDELLELANYACQSEGLIVEIRALAGLSSLPPIASLEHWGCIANLLLKKNDDAWLKKPDKRHGFPAGSKTSFESRQKARREALVTALEQVPGLLESLCDIRNLPSPHYTEEQWQDLRHMFTALRQAAYELNFVFAEQGVVDFVEIGQSALEVLQTTQRSSTAGDAKLRHLLVDEFQDTSRRQHELILSLVHGWKANDGRTIFLVGDPMQSIYMFRQADVELFDLVRKQGLQTANGALPIQTLRLTTNFRSTAGVVDPLNRLFSTVFPHDAKAEAAAVDFLPGTARDLESSPDAYQVHPGYLYPEATPEPNGADVAESPSPASTALQQETSEIMRVIRRHLPALEQARRAGKEFTIAVLARAKNHLGALAAALRDAELPFRAVDLEALGKRQEVLDLLALTRAILHPMDRIAWLALLRAPWCALGLRDLHTLCGVDEQRHATKTVFQQISERRDLLDPEPRERVSRLADIMQSALDRRHTQLSFASLIERTWRSLGGPACVDPAGHQNALTYLRMLENVAPDGLAAGGEAMEDSLRRLCAQPDPSVSERCGIQLMTIHKAKGLGFDIVLVPGLHRRTGYDSSVLIRYLERTTPAGTELLVAPIGSKGEGTSTTNKWIRGQQVNRDAEERKRLLYVACTRARQQIHLFGTVTVTQAAVRPPSGTLLQTAWPGVKQNFTDSARPQQQTPAANLILFPSQPADGPSVAGVVEKIAARAGHFNLRRLPSAGKPAAAERNVTAAGANTIPDQLETPTERHVVREAARPQRILGTVVHALFEQAARQLQQGLPREAMLAKLPAFQRQAALIGCNEGLPAAAAESNAKLATRALESALTDSTGEWILMSHDDAQIETSWTGIFDNTPRTVQIDRAFRAGVRPLSEGNDYLWIVDYKTATHSGTELNEFLAAQRRVYKGQLENYGRMMRLVHGDELEIRLGLYYPLLQEFDFWEP